MKIGIDARMYGIGFTGIGRYTAELIANLAELDQKNEYVLFMRQEGYDQFVCPNKRFKKVVADYPHYSLGEQIGFNRLLMKEKLDLVHFTHFNAPIFYTRPFVVTIHDLTLSFFPGKKMNRFIHRLAYHWVIGAVTKKAKKIIAVSYNTKKDLMETMHVPDSKIEVVYNGISPQFGALKPTPRAELAHEYDLNRPFFLYTGVWRDHKNLVGLIKAFDAFNQEVGKKYQLAITGAPNQTYHEVPDVIEALGIEKEVRLVGLVSEEDLYGLYKHALAYAFPSFYEGFGLPPLEAMQCGIPTLVSNTSSIPEVCGEGNSLFFNPYDLRDIQTQLKLMAESAELRADLIRKGKERVKFFSWKKMTEAILEVYNSYELRIKN